MKIRSRTGPQQCPVLNITPTPVSRHFFVIGSQKAVNKKTGPE